MMSLRMAVWTRAPAPVQSRSRPSQGTVSPATTTDAPPWSKRNPMLGCTGLWSVGTHVTTASPGRSTGPSATSTTSTGGR